MDAFPVERHVFEKGRSCDLQVQTFRMAFACSTFSMLLVVLPLQMVLSSVICALKAYQLSSKKPPF